MLDKSNRRLLLSFLPIVLIIAFPLAMRKPAEAIDTEADQLVIVSPHNESIRYEFEQAFRKFYHEKTGRKVSIDWRATGGTSDIVRYINSAFTSNFKVYWTKELNQPWSDEVAAAFMNRKMKPADHPARKAFLESNLGIDIDIFFGGGQYDFNKQAQMGTIVPSGFRARHPELFEGADPVLVEKRGGEIWYDKNDCYYGACFSSFGICVNRDRVEKLGLDPDTFFTKWSALGDTRLLNAIAVADPSKSGSINKCFEMLVQREMLDTMDALQPKLDSGAVSKQDALNRGWQNAMTLIKRIGGNSLYMTFSASKIPVDCASAQIAAGMCIDFYGRSQAEWEENHVGRKTMMYTTPVASSSVSCDPIGIFRGAPHRERAELFMDFVMSKEGQQLWNNRLGSKGGPIKYSLNRLPVRHDLYTDEYRKNMTAPEAAPFELANAFTYHGEWTGPFFDLLRNTIKVMVIDCEEELKEAWNAIVKNGGPEKCPQAMQFFEAMPYDHAHASEAAALLYTPETQTKTLREWGDFFRKNYRQAAKLAAQPINN
ncbi:MAG: ABC transporter substrate-binding protein [Victivallales bacterium]|nr:ABC transporter substrate-binding protein [Victivallales bacterium]